MKIKAQYIGKLPNGNLSIAITFNGAVAHVEMTRDGEIQPNHNLSPKGLKDAMRAIETLGMRTYTDRL